MKIAIISDLHLNRNVYKGIMDRKDYPSLPFRHVDFVKSFHWMIDKCINEIKPDLLTIAGDIYDTPMPSNRVRGFFSDQLRKLVAAKIPCIILIGNHDVLMKSHALEDIKNLNLTNVRVIESPTILPFKKKVKLLLFPYSLNIEQQKITPKKEFQQSFANLGETDVPLIFFGHGDIQGGSINEYNNLDYTEEIEVTNTTTTLPKIAYIDKNPNHISMEDLDKIGVKYAFWGHYHQKQVLRGEVCRAIYTGCIEKYTMHEIEHKKGFVVYDSEMPEADEDKEMGKCRFIEYPNCRPMLQLEGNFDKIKQGFQKIDYSKYQDAIVKIKFIGNANELIDFSSGLDAFKKQVNNKINPIHLFHTQNVKNPKQERAASELEKEIMEKGHLSEEDVIKVVKEIIKEQDRDVQEKDALADLATEIYREVMGK